MNKEEKELCKQVMLDLNIVRYHKTISECMVEYGKRLAKQEAKKVLDYVLTMSDLQKMVMVDGTFYWSEDEDGDCPLNAEDIIKMVNPPTIP